MKPCAKIIRIKGIVQGVGFRPFIYRLALEHGLKGEVSNTASGVLIRVEGAGDSIAVFCDDISKKAPPLSEITDISIESRLATNPAEFKIIKSDPANVKTTVLVSPDVSICEDCITELFDGTDRRFRHPFINCTNCGPRYTIIENLPYDRPFTSMKDFVMCEKCRVEYDDPNDRRFHAQPNSCPKCGPRLELCDGRGNSVKTSDPLGKTIELLTSGHIMAIKGIGGFHLAVDAENQRAVAMLRKRKHREEKPFALMSGTVESISGYAAVSPEDEASLKSAARPIVLLEKRAGNTMARSVSPNNKRFGVMLPYTPLHYLLLQGDFAALVMTSGNVSGEPIITDNAEAFRLLGGIADFFLVHDREIICGCDDSIVMNTANRRRFMRRSRGYVPAPLFLREKFPSILACGGELKNTICLTRENRVFLSQHLGDLKNLKAYENFVTTIEHMKRILDIEPAIIAFDKHPGYLSTKYALEQKGMEPVPVQHHHAHIASCMAENRADFPVIGLAFDGTGYGDDGAIWGGEVLLVESDGFERLAHMAYVPMPGGDAAVREPWRMAVSYLHNAFGRGFLDFDASFLEKIDEKKVETVLQMISKGINCPRTSSLGRLFDGVAAMIGLRNLVFFEGQAAMELEMVVKSCDSAEPYAWEFDDDNILSEPIIKGVAADLKSKASPAEISARFHATIISLFTTVCEKIRQGRGVNRVALSGGVFQNSILLSGFLRRLNERNFEVFTHAGVPANDGGLSLGQAVLAAIATDSVNRRL